MFLGVEQFSLLTEFRVLTLHNIVRFLDECLQIILTVAVGGQFRKYMDNGPSRTECFLFTVQEPIFGDHDRLQITLTLHRYMEGTLLEG